VRSPAIGGFHHVVVIGIAAVFWLIVVILLLRWPGRTLGLAGALIAWTAVGPWAFWCVLGLVSLGAIAWRRHRPEQPLVTRHPLVRIFVASAVIALVTQGPVSMVALGTALAALAAFGWAAPWATATAAPAAAAAADPATGQDSTAASAPGPPSWLTDESTCDCGGRVVAIGRVTPSHGPVEGWGLMAWASCTGCDRRFLGFIDPGSGELTWHELPPDQPMRDTA
jgi:hypothetical protein